MTTIEEKLWDYIDGNCNAIEQREISVLIEVDEMVKLKYVEILGLNAKFSKMEPDAPSMAFTYNVMEDIRAGQAAKPLQTVVNKKFIAAIGAFFMITILGLLIYAITTVNWSAGDIGVNIPLSLKIPNVTEYISKPVMEGFVFFDIVAALFLLDAYLRRRAFSK